MKPLTFKLNAVVGFSLVELMAAAAIVGLLATVAVPVIETTVRREKEHELRQALRDIRNALDAYKQATLAGRIVAGHEDSGYPPRLETLVTGVVDEKNKDGPRLFFLRRIPRDPFYLGQAVSAADTWGKRSYASPPNGPKEGVDVFDAYSKSTMTGLNGVPYTEW